jgi:eukaryotic-like serine/threonine-protein kinase
MAEVYLAVAEGLSGFEKRVVLKRLLPQHAGDAERLAMFLDEARLCAGLRHPHIAEVYDVGQEDGDYYFVMEHVPGRDLGELLAAAPGQPLPLPEALAIGRAVAEGLHHAHEHRDGAGRLLQIVHRDVSPSNVLVGVGGEIKLIDFGVAKWAAQRTETRHGVLKGKCAYMSPEQCRAEPLDRRCDLFSLGVLLYEITTGRRPFEGANDFEVMTAVVRGTFAPPSRHRGDYPPALEAVIVQALAPARQDRPATGRALAGELDAVALRHGLTSSPAAIAGLLRGAAGSAAGTAELDEAEGPGEPGEAPRRTALARTATDHSTAAPTPIWARPRRLVVGVLAGLAAAALATAGVRLVARDRAPPSRARKIAPAAPAGRPEAVVGQAGVHPESSSGAAPASAAGSGGGRGEPGGAGEGAKARAEGSRGRNARARKPSPVPAAPATAAPMRVWDPDSPTPP